MKTQIKRDHMEAILDTAEIDRDKLREAYTGRWMYGRTCPAIDVDDVAQLAAFFAAAGIVFRDLEESDDPGFDLQDLVRGVCTDSLGTGLIFYFPGLEITED